jgi:hypothetical protein
MRGGHDVACWSWHGRGLGAPLCSITISHWQTLANTGKHWQTNLLIAGLWSNNPTTGARATGTRSTEDKCPPPKLANYVFSFRATRNIVDGLDAGQLYTGLRKEGPSVYLRY